MKKNTRNVINLVFSSFLVTGYIICSYFFSNLAGQVAGFWGELIKAVILVLFGLLLFYATRVGEGKQVKRFSLVVLLLMVLPGAVITTLCLIPGIPEEGGPIVNIINALRSQPIVMMLAGVALGYGIPYSFLSGYELKTDEEAAAEAAEDSGMIAGGLAEELAEVEKEAEGEETAEETEAKEETGAEDKVEAEETEAEAEEKAETAEEAAESTEEAAEEAAEETAEATEAVAGEAVEEAAEKAE